MGALDPLGLRLLVRDDLLLEAVELRPDGGPGGEIRDRGLRRSHQDFERVAQLAGQASTLVSPVMSSA